MASKRRTGAVSRAALAAAADPRLVTFTSSIDIDRALYREDVAGSVAHVEMLAATGLLLPAEAERLIRALSQVADELARGALPLRPELEDVHTHVERRLGELVGTKLAGKLHTARSRNDQVALDERLLLVRFGHEARAALTTMQRALLSQAELHFATPMAGYTHLQRAQPVTLGHHLLAYVEMFARDKGRFADMVKRSAVSPLGSGALAATPLPIDRARVARSLGLAGITRNSIDAVSSRDAILEALSAYAIAAVHLSRLAEELCLWSSAEFGFLELDDAFCTGSSLMPQKRNPDVAELARGKSGRVIGALVTLLTVVKGLPLAYNRDLQEDKEPLLDAHATLTASLTACAGMIESARFDVKALSRTLEGGATCATDAADLLVGAGVPFRAAHALVGRMVHDARARGRSLDTLTPAELARYHPALGEAKGLFDPLRSLRSRDVVGGPAPRRVAAEVRRWKRELTF